MVRLWEARTAGRSSLFWDHPTYHEYWLLSGQEDRAAVQLAHDY
jgi:hypothetical protein